MRSTDPLLNVTCVIIYRLNVISIPFAQLTLVSDVSSDLGTGAISHMAEYSH